MAEECHLKRSANKRQKNKKKQLLKQTLETGRHQVTDRERSTEVDPNSSNGTIESSYTKREKEPLKDAFEEHEEQENNKLGPLEERNQNLNDEGSKRRKRKRNKKKDEGKSNLDAMNPNSSDGKADNVTNGLENLLPIEVVKSEEQEVDAVHPPKEDMPESKDKKSEICKLKKKQQLLEEAAKADQRGVCYLSRIPPHMDHVKLRQILSQYGEIQRIYLAPEDSLSQAPRKKANHKRDGGFQQQAFSEGWVEFTKKSIAKRVANMLNGEQIRGRKSSSFYYDLWNIKYLSKFKWDDLTAEIAYKTAVREQKLSLEISAAKRERDFYLSKVDQSRALSSIEKRLKKKQKVQQESGTNCAVCVSQQQPKVVRHFPQKQPVADTTAEKKPRLSKDILAGVFGGFQ